MEELEMASLPQEKTLLKRNNILRGIIVKDKKDENLEVRKDKLTLDSYKLYNFIYLSFQKNRKEILNRDKYEMTFRHLTIKNYLDITNNSYIEVVKNALSSLISTKISIKNFKSGKMIISEHQTNLVNSFTDYREEETGERIFKVVLDELLFKEMIREDKGYTELNFKNMKHLTSLNHIRLYEIIKSYQNMENIPAMGINDLNELFMTNLKFISKMEEIINRAIKAINSKTDIKISYTKDKRTKKIYFKIVKEKQTKEEKSKQKFATAKNIEEKNIIDNVYNKMKIKKF